MVEVVGGGGKIAGDALPKKNSPGCKCCEERPCEHCIGGTGPMEYELTAADWADVYLGCQECNEVLNGTFILTNYDECRWRYTSPTPVCTADWYIDMWISSFDQYFINVFLWYVFPGPISRSYEVNVRRPGDDYDPVDCNFVDLELTGAVVTGTCWSPGSVILNAV